MPEGIRAPALADELLEVESHSTRVFTLEEANEALPHVRLLLEQIRRAIRAFEEYGELDEDSEAPDSDTAVDPLYFRIVVNFQATLERLQEIGCEIKDVHRGLVDFPSIIDGEEVYLCWEEGEEEIGYWHRPEDGYNGRKPIG